MYTMKEKVRFSEVDHTSNITLPGIINYFQDCTIRHSEEIGVGIEFLKKFQKGWILSSWQVEVKRYPTIGETIEVGTFPTAFKGLYGMRNFFMKDADGEIVAQANSIWVFMDLAKGRPSRPNPEHINRYELGEPLDMEDKGRKISISEGGVEGESFPVRRYHIDTNEHVNNCQYVQMALEVLDHPMKVKELRVEYKKSAVYGNMIKPIITSDEERTVVQLCDESKEPYAIVEFIGE